LSSIPISRALISLTTSSRRRSSSAAVRLEPELAQTADVSLSICYRVRLFYPDRIVYHAGIGAHLLIAFLLPTACPFRTVFPWWLACPYPTASHRRPWWYLHWLPRIMLDGCRLSRVARQRKRSAGLTCHQACRRHYAVGPVAEVSTQEQCIALHPGSNPGRASNGVLAASIPCEFVRSKPLQAVQILAFRGCGYAADNSAAKGRRHGVRYAERSMKGHSVFS
jgi:hypothetical protein